jgi:anti-sigma B factor antagonist
MQFDTQQHDRTQIVAVNADRIDAMAAIQFKDSVRELLNTESERMILDLKKVDFIDSSGLGAIVALMKLLAPNCKLELAGLTGTVQKVFRLTRMDSVFTLHEHAQDGLLKPAEH